MSTKRKLSESESILLKILWSADEPLSVSQIIVKLEDKKIHWAYTTVATFLKRMENKGLISASKKGRSFCYRAEVDEDDVSDGAASFVERHFQGSLNNFLAAFSKEKGLTQDEVDNLKEWVNGLDEDNQ